jgi:LmbE family N-acetylglucosaminyl deacetylase
MTHSQYQHVYLSPHLDDAVLSCGGIIHRQAMSGEPPLVITLFAGPPPRDASLSAFAQFQHDRWGGQTVTQRWAEDQAALAELGADYVRLNYPDCIYRGREHAGEWYYASEQALFGPVHPAELGLPAELAAGLTEFIPREPATTLYAPLAAGHHVDHQLTCAAALILKMQGWRVIFYEDYPYVEKADALSQTLTARGEEAWQAVVVPLNEADLAAKIRAITCYGSQIGVLFDRVESIPDRVRSYLDLVGGERLWQPDNSQGL